MLESIASLDDPRIAAYRNLRDRTLRGESLFVAEGRVLARRLLESPYETESILVEEACAEEFAQLAGKQPGEPSAAIRQRVIAARQQQLHRQSGAGI